MNHGLIHRIAGLWRAELLSPEDFVRRAWVIGILFLIAHLAGLREYACFLSGTVVTPETGSPLPVFLGLTYVVLYFAAVLLIPILLLAAGIAAAIPSIVWRQPRPSANAA